MVIDKNKPKKYFSFEDYVDNFGSKSRNFEEERSQESERDTGDL